MSETVVHKAIVQYGSEASRVSLNFTHSVGNKSRNFNLNRLATESVSSVLARIETNIVNKMVAKRKKKKNDDAAEAAEDVSQEEYVAKMLESSEPVNDVNTLADVERLNLLEVDGEMSCHDAFVTNGSNHLLQLGTLYYKLDINPPTADALSLPSNIMAGFLLYPNYLDTNHAVLVDCNTRWFISKSTFTDHQQAKAHLNSIVWQELQAGFTLRTTDDMVGKLLKVVFEPRNGQRCGVPVEAVARALVSGRPPHRPYMDRHSHTTAPTPHNMARVVSYNLLAETYSSTTYSAEVLFSSCPGYALDGFYRKQLLIDEILGYHGDILCLQEVDEDLFQYDLSRVLPLEGPYAGHYSGKTSTSTKEGSATFYNTDKFRLLEAETFTLSEQLSSLESLAGVWAAVQRNPLLLDRVTTRTSVMQVCVLERIPAKSDGAGSSCRELVIVGNTHFYFHPDADHIRLIQSVTALAILENTAKLWPQKLLQNLQNKTGNTEDDTLNCRISVIFCGDLNSTPDTGVYELATSGRVTERHHGWSGHEKEKVEGVDFEHSIPLASACGSPAYTNYTVNFNGCLDWIFYQTDRFDVAQVVPLPSHEVVTAHTALPSPVIPSDHLALIADLAFKS